MKVSRFFIRLFLVLSLMGWGQFVFAVDYFWYVPPSVSPSYPSAIAACDKRAANATASLPPGDAYTTNTVVISGSSGTCYFKFNGSGSYGGGVVNRSGDSCPLGATYNAATGECEAPEPDQCEPTIGQSINHEHQIYTVAGEPKVDPPGSICENSCQFAFSGTAASDCYRFVDGSKTGGFCKYRYQGNGVSCTADNPQPGSVFDQPPTKPPVDRDPKLEKDQTCDTWVTQPDGTLKRECTSSEAYVDPGLLNCENSNGLVGCTTGKPAPALYEKVVTQDIEQKTNPDGSVTTTTTTTTTTITCYGAKDCKDQSSVQTDKSTTGADGESEGEESTCTGSLCGSGLDPDADPSKDPDQEEEELPARTATAGSCDVALACEGDPIDCAILAKQKEQLCHAEEQSDFEGKRSDIAALFEGDQFELDTSDIQAPSFINQGTRFLPASGCPAPQTLSLTSNGGHTFQLSYDPICSFASDFSFLIVTMMGIWCAVYVGRAFGGE